MARTRRTVTRRAVTARTAARRARKLAAEAAAKPVKPKKADSPETIGQARVWQRKKHRYEIAGLCSGCASVAAYGHAEGFQIQPNPCSRCQPLVDKFPNNGPRGSKWRKILDKLEYMTEEKLSAWLDAHWPDEDLSEKCEHPWCATTGYKWERV